MEDQTSQLKRGGGIVGPITVLVIVVALLIAGYFFLLKPRMDKDKTEAFKPKEDKYYAVFLTNGQAYFGKLTNLDENFATIEKIYYLKVNQKLQPIEPKEGEESKDQKQEQSSELQLVKLGGEIHGPEDRMDINKEHILFFEELKNDSEVVKTIEKQK